MYMPVNPIDRPEHIISNIDKMLLQVWAFSDVSSALDVYPDQRKAAKQDLEYAIAMLTHIRGNNELVILRKIAFAMRVYFSWELHKVTQEDPPKLYYQF